MTGMILDGVLMLLLVAALGYGIRLEKKLGALRAGQLAFASAVTDLNAAAGRAEAALASLRASGQETDLLHDRIVKAREVKAQLETLIAKGGATTNLPPLHGEGRSRSEPGGEVFSQAQAPRQVRTSPPGLGSASPALPGAGRENAAQDDGRAQRMAALAQRIQGMAAPTPAEASPRPALPGAGRENVRAILSAMTTNQSAKQSLNQARRNLDEDLFAA